MNEHSPQSSVKTGKLECLEMLFSIAYVETSTAAVTLVTQCILERVCIREAKFLLLQWTTKIIGLYSGLHFKCFPLMFYDLSKAVNINIQTFHLLQNNHLGIPSFFWRFFFSFQNDYHNNLHPCSNNAMLCQSPQQVSPPLE